MSTSVIIPSKTHSNISPCVQAVRDHEPRMRVIVVDDGIDGEYDADCRIEGIKPFIFARATNQGITAALSDPSCDSVVLLNDDALLKTPEGFTRLAELTRYPDIGIIAPVTNVTGQPLQMPRNIGLRQVPHIAFVCVLIPRRTIAQVGLLDERYCIDYGVEDRDYCEAVNRAGLKVCVYDHAFVDHGSLHSSFRGDPKTPRPFTQNLRLFQQKWGIAG